MAKMKHWAGYGTIDVKKVSYKKVPQNPFLKEMIIRISGDHEQGVFRDDKWDIFNWFVKKYDKEAEFTDVVSMNVNFVHDMPVETAEYSILIDVSKRM